MQDGYAYFHILAVTEDGAERRLSSIIARNPTDALVRFGQDVMNNGYCTNLEFDTRNAVMVTVKQHKG